MITPAAFKAVLMPIASAHCSFDAIGELAVDAMQCLNPDLIQRTEFCVEFRRRVWYGYQ